MRRGASARDNALDELVRMRDTLALREEQIKSERARVRELELQLQLREKEMEIERLKAMVASVGDGNGTTATLGANEYAQPRTLERATDSGRASARSLEAHHPVKEKHCDPAPWEQFSGARSHGTIAAPGSRMVTWSKEEEDALLDFVIAAGHGPLPSGSAPVAAFRPNNVLLDTLSRFTAGYKRTLASVMIKFNGHSRCSEKMRQRYAAAFATNAEKTGLAPQRTQDQNRRKASTQSRPVGIVVENGSLSSHAHIKLRKTTHAVLGKNGEIVFTPIEGVKFCHRCKRTNREGAAFAGNNNSMCSRCCDRVKELAEARDESGSPAKKLKLSLPPVGPDGKRDLLQSERMDKWKKIVKAVVAGDVDLLNKYKQQFEADKALYRNMVEWDQEIFQIAAEHSKHPLRVINWALLNHAQRDEINEGAIKCAVARKKTVETTPVDGSPYTPAVKVLKHLIKCKFPVTCEEVHTACAFGDLECVEYLKSHVPCCNFTEWFDPFMRPDGEPNQLMLIAAQEGHFDVLKYLYDNDCDFSVDDAHTCLHLAKTRTPKRAHGYALVKAYIESLPEFLAPSLKEEVEE